MTATNLTNLFPPKEGENKLSLKSRTRSLSTSSSIFYIYKAIPIITIFYILSRYFQNDNFLMPIGEAEFLIKIAIISRYFQDIGDICDSEQPLYPLGGKIPKADAFQKAEPHAISSAQLCGFLARVPVKITTVEITCEGTSCLLPFTAES